jgi:hypothetical protein
MDFENIIIDKTKIIIQYTSLFFSNKKIKFIYFPITYKEIFENFVTIMCNNKKKLKISMGRSRRVKCKKNFKIIE